MVLGSVEHFRYYTYHLVCQQGIVNTAFIAELIEYRHKKIQQQGMCDIDVVN